MRRAPSTHTARKVAVSHSPKPASRHRAGGRVEAIEKDESGAEAPFEEGAHDTLDADLRHRMISEAAYQMYAQRGYADGYDLDDWLEAETLVDHITIGPDREDKTDEGASETARTSARSRRSEAP